ncbi:MAG: flagella basal body P-ring formation protein FlgA [Candidatus Acidiferrum sp.]
MLSRRWSSARRAAQPARTAGGLRRVAVCLLAGSLGAAFFAGNSEAGAVRIALLAEAKIPGEAIVLADLLPAGVPDRVRALADAILLGRTPQSGSSRYLSGATVAEAIERTGTSASSFAIPELIAVQRLDRALDGEEILSSIRHAIAKFSLTPGEEAALMTLQQSDLSWDAALRVPLGDARLQVAEIFVDLVRGRADVRMTAESQAHTVPFVVVGKTASRELAVLRDDEASPGARLASYSAPRGPALTAPADGPAAGPVLIAAGHTAQLRLHSEHSNIVLEVQALEAGHAGETIRVRLPVSGRTLRAQVTGYQTLDASF